ncbi:MAG: PAS domain-containing protein [Pseudomonadota bacterium]
MSTGHDQPEEQKVLSIAPHARVSAKIDRVEAYWNSVRGKRLVPSRCEIDPRGLEGMLGNAFILERIAGGLARFRIAGSHLTDLAGLELRQMPLSALFLPGSREILSDALQSVFDDPAVVRMTVSSPAGFGRERLQGELILLPLRSDLGDVDRILGAVIFEGRIGRTPRRIEIATQSRASLTGFAGPLPTVPSPLTPITAPARPSASVTPEMHRTRPLSASKDASRSHLRLIVSND